MLRQYTKHWPLIVGLAATVGLGYSWGRAASPTIAVPPPLATAPGESIPAELFETDFGNKSPPPATERLPASEEMIAGTIVLPPARRSRVTKGETIFVSARRSALFAGSAPASLVAAQRLEVSEFPLPFALSARDAMIPGTPFQGLLTITVRVDQDGDPLTRQKGDLYGQVVNVAVGATELVVSLDSLQSEEVTLEAGPLMDRSGLPPGHP